MNGRLDDRPALGVPQAERGSLGDRDPVASRRVLTTGAQMFVQSANLLT